MSQDNLTLRALEPGDIEVLLVLKMTKSFGNIQIRGNLSQDTF